VNRLDPAVPGTSLGHFVEIPDFGRIFLGEVIASPTTVRLTMIRAELGCTIGGSIGGVTVNSNGNTVPPGQPY
jgi:hypothetical protein